MFEVPQGAERGTLSGCDQDTFFTYVKLSKNIFKIFYLKCYGKICLKCEYLIIYL